MTAVPTHRPDLSSPCVAAEPPRSAPPSGPLGISGTRVWSGVVEEEYNPKLAGELALQTYEQMLRDPQVRALKTIVTLPIHAATPTVEPAGDGAANQEAAKLIETNLLSGMTMTYDDLLRHALLAIFWGFAVQEKVFEERDGRVMWRKLPGRHPRTIEKWIFDDEGDPVGIKQRGTDVNGEEHEVEIPIDRLIIFTWEECFQNPQGRALFRSVYKPWFMADWVYRVVNIGIERFWLNLPIAKEPPNVPDKQRRDVLKILKGFRAHEYAGAIEPHGWEFKFLEAMQRSGGDISIKLLDHYDHKILLSGLGQFLMLGTTATGSRAVSDDHSEMFLRAEDAVARWFVETMNRHAIPQLCRYNWPGLTEYPKLRIPPMATIVRQSAILEGLAKAVDTALLSPDSNIENLLRAMWGLPAIEEEEGADETRPEPSEQPEDDADAVPAGARVSRASGVGPATARDLSPRERRFQLQRVRQLQDDAQEALGGDMRDLLGQQLDRLAETLRRPVAAAVDGGKRARARLLKTLRDLELPFARRYENTLRAHLQEIAGEGARLASEVVQGAPADVVRRLRPELDAIAHALAEKHAGDVLFALREQVPRDVAAGLKAHVVLRNIRQAVRDRASQSLSASLHEAADRIVAQLTQLQGE